LFTERQITEALRGLIAMTPLLTHDADNLKVREDKLTIQHRRDPPSRARKVPTK
jgi:hypothetical protein